MNRRNGMRQARHLTQAATATGRRPAPDALRDGGKRPRTVAAPAGARGCTGRSSCTFEGRKAHRGLVFPVPELGESAGGGFRGARACGRHAHAAAGRSAVPGRRPRPDAGPRVHAERRVRVAVRGRRSRPRSGRDAATRPFDHDQGSSTRAQRWVAPDLAAKRPRTHDLASGASRVSTRTGTEPVRVTRRGWDGTASGSPASAATRGCSSCKPPGPEDSSATSTSPPASSLCRRPRGADGEPQHGRHAGRRRWRLRGTEAGGRAWRARRRRCRKTTTRAGGRPTREGSLCAVAQARPGRRPRRGSKHHARAARSVLEHGLVRLAGGPGATVLGELSSSAPVSRYPRVGLARRRRRLVRLCKRHGRSPPPSAAGVAALGLAGPLSGQRDRSPGSSSERRADAAPARTSWVPRVIDAVAAVDAAR